MKHPSKTTNDYSEAEAEKRFEKTLRGALNTKPQPLKSKPKARRPSEKSS